MENNQLTHHGVLGMKWGVRRTPAQLGHVSRKRKKTKKADVSNKKEKAKVDSKKTKKSVNELTDAELKDKINRLELEKRYKDLAKGSEPPKKGKAFVMDVLEKSGKNIATQLATYAMGAAVNKIAGSDIVNPKKGQKDK